MANQKRRIGALVFQGVETLDLFGPVEMFGTLSEDFDIALVAETTASLQTRHGQTIVPDHSVEEDLAFDMIFVPGGPGTPIKNPVKAIDDWLIRQAESAEVVMSVCTGSGLLARIGLLDGRRATTNKRAFNWVRQFGPKVDWVQRARWVSDAKYYTSSGVSAGMDMSLAVIAGLKGRDAAEEVANITEYTWHRDAADDPFATEAA